MNATLAYLSHDPEALIVVGLLTTGYGIFLIKRGIEGDTLMPGTSFTYLPRWVFIGAGILLQLPLPAAFWFLKFAKAAWS